MLLLLLFWMFQLILLLQLCVSFVDASNSGAAAGGNRSSLPMSEMIALEDLFQSTSGSGWHWRKNHHTFGVPWNFSRINNYADAAFIHDPCTEEWQGISCTCNITVFHTSDYTYYDDGDDLLIVPLPSTPCFIDSLNLPGRNLCGRIAPSISNLTHLQHLHLENNSITGPFIPQLCDLPNLLGLHLTRNQMTRSIPSCIYKLSNLQQITLARNHFSRKIPTTIALMGNLTFINLNFNKLTGQITSLGVLRNLNGLALDTNSLSGSIPEGIGFNTGLTILGTVNRIYFYNKLNF